MKYIKNSYLILIPVVWMSFVWMQNSFVFPPYFPQPSYDFKTNPLDSSLIQLGRALFYDPILSKNNTISCASCHSPYNAFAHTDHDLSHGIDDQIGTRNAPALFNLAWHKTFMWDGAIHHLDVQSLAPITHPKEMGESIPSLVKKLTGSNMYKRLFFNIYKDSLITGERILKSIAQFELTLISANAKYDRVLQGRDTFTHQEKNGYQIFKNHCNACHTEPLFTNSNFADNGLSLDTTLLDYGRYHVTKNPKDSLKFKTPSLRNLSYSYPFMHDGRFKKLNQVINHYTNIVKSKRLIADELSDPIILTANEKVDLISFLLTLNDKDFVFNPKHQFPKNILLSSEGMNK